MHRVVHFSHRVHNGPMRSILILLGLTVAGVAKPALPQSVRANPLALEFHVAPLSHGTTDEQVRAAVAYLRKATHGGRIVKLRVFMSGVDIDAVAGLVREALPAKQLPIVSVIAVGALADPAAHVVIEALSEAKTPVNPNGVAFISGQATNVPLEGGTAAHPVTPLAAKSIASLEAILSSLGLGDKDLLQITCFASSLEDYPQLLALVKGKFAGAQVNILEIQRTPANQVVECESVARLRVKPTVTLLLENPTNAQFAQAALVAAPEIIFTATQFGAEQDLRQGFLKTKQALEEGGANLYSVFYAYAYPTSAALLQKYRDLRWEFLDRARAPASTNLPFEPRAAGDGSLGIDVIALPAK